MPSAPLYPRSVAAVGLAIAITACDPADSTGVQNVESATHEVASPGGQRTYRVFAPESLDRAGQSPLLIAFHGASQGAMGIELMSWLYPEAEEYGLLLAFPEASGDYWNTPNSPASYWGVPDVAFVDALIADVDQRYGVDRTRIYLTGFSNGAIFAQAVACLRGDAIAGLSFVGAGISAELASTCPWARPLPMVAFLGDRDPQFFWDDGIAAGVGMLGGPGSAAWMAATNECGPPLPVEEIDPVPDDDTTVQRTRYSDCAAESPVHFYRIAGGGHTWPGSPLNLAAGFGRKSRDLQASRVLVEFLSQYSLPEASP